jgi:hypothetical protein
MLRARALRARASRCARAARARAAGMRAARRHARKGTRAAVPGAYAAQGKCAYAQGKCAASGGGNDRSNPSAMADDLIPITDPLYPANHRNAVNRVQRNRTADNIRDFRVKTPRNSSVAAANTVQTAPTRQRITGTGTSTPHARL